MPMPLNVHRPYRTTNIIRYPIDAVAELHRLADDARRKERRARCGYRHYPPNPQRAEYHRIAAEAFAFAATHIKLCITRSSACPPPRR